MKVYPSTRYHPELGVKLVKSAEEDAALKGWFESPADYGVETCPAKSGPDPVIAAKRVKAPEADSEIIEEIKEIIEKPAKVKRAKA